MVDARSTERHEPRRPWRRALLIAAAVLAVAVGAGAAYVALRGDPVSLGSSGPDPKEPARLFTTAWRAGDYRTMYGQLSPASRSAIGYGKFLRTYQRAATLTTLKTLKIDAGTRVAGHTVTVPMQMQTRMFGALAGPLTLPWSTSRARTRSRGLRRWSGRGWPRASSGRPITAAPSSRATGRCWREARPTTVSILRARRSTRSPASSAGRRRGPSGVPARRRGGRPARGTDRGVSSSRSTVSWAVPRASIWSPRARPARGCSPATTGGGRGMS